MEVARGAVRDQPWGLTLGAFAQRATTGELTIVDGATRVTLVLEDGLVVAGSSTRNAPSLLERAARTFDLANATYSVDNQITQLRRDNGAAVDLREVIFTGARRYLDDDRLHAELRQLGTRFSLGPGGAAELPRYGGEAPAVIAAALRDGASVAELELAYPQVDRRAIQALLYALVSCGACRGLLPARAPTPPPDASRTTTPNRAAAALDGQPRTTTPNAARTTTPSTARTTTPSTARTTTPNTTRTTTPARTITPNSARAITPDGSRAANPDGSRTTTPDGSRPATQHASSPNDSGTALLARIPTVNVARNPTPPGARAPTPPGARTTTPAGGRTTTTPDPAPMPRTATTKDAVPLIPSAGDDVEASRTATRREPNAFESGPPTVRTPVPPRDAVPREPVQPRDAVPRAAEPPPKRAPIALPDEYSRSPHAARDDESRPHRTGASRDDESRAKPAVGRGGPSSRATPSHGVRIIAPDDEATYRAALAADRARRLLEAHEYVEAQKEALAATRLVPESFDYQALHAWATFCGSRDKPAVADATRKLLEKASHRADAPHEVRLLLGRLERTVGREREALRHFRAVIEREPGHAEAAAQIRELEAQLEAFARR